MLSRIILLIAALHMLSGRLLAQGPSAPIHLSPRLGQPVTHPESLSGLWEAPDGNGGAVGLHLHLTTTVPAYATTLSGVTQSWFSLTIGLYQRRGAAVQMGEENFFVDSYPDSGIQFDQGRLTLHFASSHVGVPPVDLDLVQQPGSAWEGRFHRGDFDSRVKLLRPGVGKPLPVAPLLGTWSEYQPNFPNFPVSHSCIHVAQQTATEWIGWADLLTVLGNMQYPPHISRPATAEEHYGDLIKIQLKQDRSFSFEFGGNGAVCCPSSFVGKLSAAGTLLEGVWAGLNQSSRPGSWKKMKGDSCIDPED